MIAIYHAILKTNLKSSFKIGARKSNAQAGWPNNEIQHFILRPKGSAYDLDFHFYPFGLHTLTGRNSTILELPRNTETIC